MFAAIDLNEEMGPTGFFIFAGILAVVALGTLVFGLHPRWRRKATWRGLIARSPTGSVLFSVGALVMAQASCCGYSRVAPLCFCSVRYMTWVKERGHDGMA